MQNEVAIIGIGKVFTGSNMKQLACNELLYKGTKLALDDAGLTGENIDITISAANDFLEGRALANQGPVDPLGGVHKESDIRVCDDAIHGILAGYFEALTNPGKIVVVGSVQKGSERCQEGLADQNCLLSALDPAYSRPVFSSLSSIAGIEYALAAMEMRRYMHVYGISEQQIAKVVVKNVNNASRSRSAEKEAVIGIEDVLSSEHLSGPLKRMEVARATDGSCTIIMCTLDKAREITKKAVKIKGFGWCSGSSLMQLRKLEKALYTYEAAKNAYSMAGIKNPSYEIQLAEVNDTYAYKELQHCEALGFCEEGKGAEMVEQGFLKTNGHLAVNPCGGLLGRGNPASLGGLIGVAEAALQIRGDAGPFQISGVETALAHSWSGFPFHCGTVIILGN
jgi:acetyl-CoA C-acetyltransferase